MNYGFAEYRLYEPFTPPIPIIFIRKNKPLWRKSVILIEISVLDRNENCLCYTLLFRRDKLNGVKNLYILNATIEYIPTIVKTMANNPSSEC